jgi:hypothetical protein
MKTLLRGRNEEAIGNILKMLHEPGSDSPYKGFMPPLVGAPEEIDALRSYLHSLVKGTE